MPGEVRIRYGDVFSEPAGLAILPCSTDGRLERFADRTRAEAKLPPPPPNMALGEVWLVSLADSLLQMPNFAYIAVRDHTGSNPNVLYAAGKALAELTVAHTEISTIAAPLLGTGAGGVELITAVEALATAFRTNARDGTTLVLCAPRKSSYDRLMNWLRNSTPTWKAPPRTFISYNKRTQMAWVEGLCERLRMYGVEAILDRDALEPTMELERWMTNEISSARKVIIVSDEEYAYKANNRIGGVGFEACIIANAIEDERNRRKFITIIRSKNITDGTPQFLLGRYLLHCYSDIDFQSTFSALLKKIYEIDETPQDGAPPLFMSQFRPEPWQWLARMFRLRKR